MTHIPDSWYCPIIIVILSFSGVKIYVFIQTTIICYIRKLEMLIQQEEERDKELEEKITMRWGYWKKENIKSWLLQERF